MASWGAGRSVLVRLARRRAAVEHDWQPTDRESERDRRRNSRRSGHMTILVDERRAMYQGFVEDAASRVAAVRT